MPELPDVESFRIYLDATSLHKEIKRVRVNSPIVIEGFTPQEFSQKLVGHKFERSDRHGKYLFAGLDAHKWLVFHFGMTGKLAYFKDMQDKPDYDQLLFYFANGYHLAYVMPRKLGNVTVRRDIESFIREKELGPDALDPNFDSSAFKAALSGRRGMAKSTLMNQRIIAGIGNVYSDEILFQSRIHPKKKIKHMDEETLHTIFENMKQVLRTAVDHMADTEKYPQDYIIPNRHGDQICPNCGGEVKNIKVSGRSGYYCPACQKK